LLCFLPFDSREQGFNHVLNLERHRLQRAEQNSHHLADACLAEAEQRLLSHVRADELRRRNAELACAELHAQCKQLAQSEMQARHENSLLGISVKEMQAQLALAQQRADIAEASLAIINPDGDSSDQQAWEQREKALMEFVDDELRQHWRLADLDFLSDEDLSSTTDSTATLNSSSSSSASSASAQPHHQRLRVLATHVRRLSTALSSARVREEHQAQLLTQAQKLQQKAHVHATEVAARLQTESQRAADAERQLMSLHQQLEQRDWSELVESARSDMSKWSATLSPAAAAKYSRSTLSKSSAASSNASLSSSTIITDSSQSNTSEASSQSSSSSTSTSATAASSERHAELVSQLERAQAELTLTEQRWREAMRVNDELRAELSEIPKVCVCFKTIIRCCFCRFVIYQVAFLF
jgi:LysM repeat protein